MKRAMMLALILMTVALLSALSLNSGATKFGQASLNTGKAITTHTITINNNSDDDDDADDEDFEVFRADDNSEEDNSPFLGVSTEDLTLDEARKVGYNQFYGILVTDIVRNSPAQFYGVRVDDILMQLGEDKIKNTDQFSSLLDSRKVGDKTTVTLFRDGEVKTIDFVIGTRHHEIAATGEIIKPEKPRLPVGNGGGSWIPMWYMPDLDDVNEVLTAAGFDELRDDGLFMNGLGGEGNIGKGWFLGGCGEWYSMERNTNHVDLHNVATIRRLSYRVGFGGVTLNKRYALSHKFVTSVGGMIGWGGTTIEMNQIDGDFDWTNINGNLENSNNNYICLKKGYIMIQPKVAVMYRITDWLSLRAEGGYIKSYSYVDGWNSRIVEENYRVKNSPDTSFDGYTISIGPWFGF
jgi:hypothetical protein